MFCKKCGKEISDEAVICPFCGCATSDNTVQKQEVKKSSNGLSIAGFIVSLASFLISLWCIVSVVGIALSEIGRGKAKKEGAPTGLATAGMVLGIISAVLELILRIVGISLLTSIV